MENKFEITLNKETFYFIIDKDNYVWYLDKENDFVKIANIFFMRAKNLDDAKSIAVEMLYTMGLI